MREENLKGNTPNLLRFFDIILSFFGILLCIPVFLIIYFIGYLDTGSSIFKQVRIGKNKKPFTLLKFRTMKLTTKSVASHLANSDDITSFGKFLRKTKLDELPQLWNVLKGEMSIVGPRPGLFDQKKLTLERSKLNIYFVRPGITGLAQVKGIDMSTPELIAKMDSKLIKTLTILTYFSYIFKTLIGKGSGDRIHSK